MTLQTPTTRQKQLTHMPFDDSGKFRPKPFRPLSGSLFEVIPPDHPDENEAATDDDRDWYQQLVDTTAELLVYIVDNVRENYDRRRSVAFNRRTVKGMDAIADKIVPLLDNELTSKQISHDVNRLAKQFGLVVYSTERSFRENWPMASRPTFTHEEAAAIVNEAFWCRFPTERQPTQTRTRR